MAVSDEEVTLALGQLEHEVRVPEIVRRQLQASIGQEISLHTIEYIEGNTNGGRLVPRLVGFLNEAEREFFDLFCEVDGVGVKKALRAMVRPVREVAELIEHQDAKGLSALPGVGPATSERIIAKLRRRMPKFALLVAREAPTAAEVAPDVVQETFSVLTRLGHTESDARKLIDAALAAKKKYADVEALINAIYQQTQAGRGKSSPGE